MFMTNLVLLPLKLFANLNRLVSTEAYYGHPFLSYLFQIVDVNLEVIIFNLGIVNFILKLSTQILELSGIINTSLGIIYFKFENFNFNRGMIKH